MIARCSSRAGCGLLFAPPIEALYPTGFQTWIEPGAVAEPNEGAHRPGHFRGVATVVLKLLNIVQPTRAYFGQKDAQQLAVVRALVRDLDVPTEIVGVPTVREPDGLAMSSRNVRLTSEHRRAATVLHRALAAGARAGRSGIRDAVAVRRAVLDVLATEPLADVDYVSVADPDTLQELETFSDRALLSLAVTIGRARLIDNLVIEPVAGSGDSAI